MVSRNLGNIQLFHDAELEVIGSKMPRNVEGSEDAIMGKKVEEIATVEEDRLKEKKRHNIDFKMKRASKYKAIF